MGIEDGRPRLSGIAASGRAGSLAVAGGFALLTIFFSGVFPPFANPNELSRLEAVYAAVEHGTFAIDDAIPVLGDHEDKAVSGGRFYSNKPPGLILAALPVYRALRIFLPPPHRPYDPIFLLLRILTVSLVSVAALSRFAARAERFAAGPLVVFAVAFGTPFVFYARSFFAHAWAAALLFLAWDRLAPGTTGRRLRAADAFAGAFLAGWAAISEYTAAPLAAALVLGRALPARRTLAAAAGVALPLAALLAYDRICFGSALVLSSAREAYPAYARLADAGLFGVGAPSLDVARRYLFDPARGLLLFSPFFVFALPGAAAWWRSREDRAGAWIAAGGVLLFFVLLTGYPNWHGGWAVGDRYLLPGLFLAGLTLPRALSTPAARGLFAAAAAFAAAMHLTWTASFPHVPPDLFSPPANAAAWFLARGWVAESLLSGAGAASLLLPAGIGLAALALALRASLPSRLATLAAAAGIAVFAATLAHPPEIPYSARLWRAAVYGAYSGRDPSRGELRAVADSARTERERRQALAAWRLYGPR